MSSKDTSVQRAVFLLCVHSVLEKYLPLIVRERTRSGFDAAEARHVIKTFQLYKMLVF